MFIAALRVNASCVTADQMSDGLCPGQLKVRFDLLSTHRLWLCIFPCCECRTEMTWPPEDHLHVSVGIPQGTVNGRWFWLELKLTDSVECSLRAPGRNVCLAIGLFD